MEHRGIDFEFDSKINIPPTADEGIIDGETALAPDMSRNADPNGEEGRGRWVFPELGNDLAQVTKDLIAIRLGREPHHSSLHDLLGKIDENSVEMAGIEVETRITAVAAPRVEKAAGPSDSFELLDSRLADNTALDHAIDATTGGRLGDPEAIREVSSRDFLSFSDLLDDESLEGGRVHDPERLPCLDHITAKIPLFLTKN